MRRSSGSRAVRQSLAARQGGARASRTRSAGWNKPAAWLRLRCRARVASAGLASGSHDPQPRQAPAGAAHLQRQADVELHHEHRGIQAQHLRLAEHTQPAVGADLPSILASPQRVCTAARSGARRSAHGRWGFARVSNFAHLMRSRQVCAPCLPAEQLVGGRAGVLRQHVHRACASPALLLATSCRGPVCATPLQCQSSVPGSESRPHPLTAHHERALELGDVDQPLHLTAAARIALDMANAQVADAVLLAARLWGRQRHRGAAMRRAAVAPPARRTTRACEAAAGAKVTPIDSTHKRCLPEVAYCPTPKPV